MLLDDFERSLHGESRKNYRIGLTKEFESFPLAGNDFPISGCIYFIDQLWKIAENVL